MSAKEIIIIGGGIVGLATAHAVCNRYPDAHITVLEKEKTLAFHQTGRNSGVLHSGIYYKPNSLKALNCRTGKQMMEDFCRENGIEFKLVGKVIVATDEKEFPAMQNLYERGQANGVVCEMIGRERLLELEPHVLNGIRAIHVPESGIVDYVQVCARLADLLRRGGHDIMTDTEVKDIVERNNSLTLVTTAGEFTADYLVNCAGLHSDRVTKMSAGEAPARIIPFRGEYFELMPEAWHLCNALIYPVPDPNFPFLGVHFTRMISGGVECGPNAVLAFAREGYHLTDVNAGELWETLSYPGFRKLAGRYWKMGLGEMWRSASKAAFVKALQRLIPEIRIEHLEEAPAGIRAQALAADGALLDDFAFHESARIVNVINAPSPAATSALSIAEAVVDKLENHFI
ncbi:MAG: L-2-hydroxyglutarate oxidase [Anaerolineales bacterium]|uniref:L-2-hydroxyglutarate oxidase n=1 Tax=Promineifilum sp. TaxID=2664178 RepID=UPI001D642B2C|nr:L-2-hydroxyglutarate oxidase [Anaerolineales bacterium]MCO5178560.1 L-2-hydroxyglutarate oxidase [Promineifilum sp.]